MKRCRVSNCKQERRGEGRVRGGEMEAEQMKNKREQHSLYRNQK